MEITRLQRTEGNAVYNFLTCAPLILFAFVVSRIVGLWYPEVQDTVLALVAILMSCFYLWWIGALLRNRWYLEFNEDEGVIYKVFLIRYVYPWEDIESIHGRKTPGFTGKYNDILVVQTSTKEKEFFLPNFSLHSKKKTRLYIDAMVETWKRKNPSGVAKDDEYRETDTEDIYDDEY